MLVTSGSSAPLQRDIPAEPAVSLGFPEVLTGPARHVRPLLPGNWLGPRGSPTRRL